MIFDANGKWKLYTTTIPAAGKPLGTIRRDVGDTGALVLIENTGVYVQVNAGVIRSLPQREVKQILGQKICGGRPRFGDEPMKKMTVMLDQETIAAARELGCGNLSAGLRQAVQRLNKS